ncbi:MAG: DUF1232 domain-containing protein [Verrucomicrobiota bacterium]
MIQGVSTYVHDGKTLASLQGEMSLLRMRIGKPKISWKSCDFARLREELIHLPEELESFRRAHEPASPASDSEPTTWLGLEENRGFGLRNKESAPWSLGIHGVADLEERVAPLVGATESDGFASSFELFLVRSAQASVEDGGGLADYLCLFSPYTSPEEEVPPSLLENFFQQAAWVLDPNRDSTLDASGAWEVLRDPDPYFLRLRGEVHQLARVCPQFSWLPYLQDLPDLFRLHARLLFDPRLSSEAKLLPLSAVAYLVAPVEFLPEAFLGPMGYVEDVLLLACVITELKRVHALSDGLLIDHWSGDKDSLDRLLEVSSHLVDGLAFFGRIRSWFEEGNPFR